MDNFNTREWFKNQYLEEANINEETMSKEDAFRALRDIEANMAKWRGPEGENYRTLMGRALDSLQAAEITAMMDREKGM
jgi:arsenate reductase-like glutaredoxin family protein